MADKNISKKLTQFSGVYVSGFFISNPKYVTALALLFDKVFIPNNIELAIDFTKHFRFSTPTILDEINIKFTFDNKLTRLYEELEEYQKETFRKYLFYSYRFCVQNRELFSELFTTNFIDNVNFESKIELVEKGINGKEDIYSMSFNPITLSGFGVDQISEKINTGFVPIIGAESKNIEIQNKSFKTSKSIATLFAMKSIEMMIPAVKQANPQDILEARERLKDFLPPFWSAMLKFSANSKHIISNSSNVNEAILECQNIVDVNIRPVLIDLNEKLIKERKNFFFKILSNIGTNVNLIIGKPNLTKLDLISSSLAFSTNVGLDFLSHKMQVDSLKEEVGLTYLLKLGDYYENKNNT